MANDEHVVMLARGATVWNEWRATHDEMPNLSRAGLRGLDLSGFDLSRADLRGADLRGTNLSGANLSVAHLEAANFFKAMLDGADLAGAFLYAPNSLIVPSSWSPGTGDHPSGMTRSPVARLFQTGNHQNDPGLRM
jgi:hypothetical protein